MDRYAAWLDRNRIGLIVLSVALKIGLAVWSGRLSATTSVTAE